MAWSMPTGPWNPGMMPPDMSMASMGSYPQEQWAALQQQNWQQWAQWQQQYAQWQTQYGDKYAEQMQAIQTMGGMPPLPPANTAPPPAPPPPDQPPPPLPHENNTPLYGKTPNQPTPVPPPATNRNTNFNSNNQAGNNSNWSHGSDAAQQPSAVNSEALKKLAEEERLFDIQFQKWEEEIEKWKKENVNHPDKQAYTEYEQKFEACRAQLLERRQQMNIKRARLTGAPVPSNTPQPPNASVAVPTSIPPPLNTPNNLNMQSQKFPNKSSQNYDSNNQYQCQQYNAPPTHYNRNNKSVDPQDRFESYRHDDHYSSKSSLPNFSHPDNATFLSKSSSNKGIPGLDLVPDDKAKQPDVIDITDENNEGQVKAPDYSTISKGINNILGDETIMNILSMVRGQGTQDFDKNAQNSAPNRPYGGNNQESQYRGNQGPNRNNSQFGETQPPNFGGNNFQRGPNNQGKPQFGGAQFQGNNPNNAPYGGNNQQNPRFGMNNQPYGQSNRNQNFNNQQNDDMQNMPYKQGPNNPGQQNQQMNNYPQRPYDQRQVPIAQDQYNNDNSNAQFRGQNMPQSFENAPPPLLHGRSNGPPGRPPPRPLMQDMPGQPIGNEYPTGPPDRRPLVDANINPVMNQPPKTKWVEDPLFTPSVVVEYEHKPLRLKAREFIEPVHMFDYNHKSKDSEDKKMDFEKEAEELFSRKPRRFDSDYPNDRVGRDFERRPREDDRTRGHQRNSFDDRRKFESRDARGPDFRDRPDARGSDYRDRPDFRDRPDRSPEFRDRADNRGFDHRDRPDGRNTDFRDRRDDRDKFTRREPPKERARDFYRDDNRNRSRSRDKDSRKRGMSKESEVSVASTKKAKEAVKVPEAAKHVVMIDDILEPPGREMRPDKIVIILRGPPGSGKSYLAKLIRDREAEYGSTVRIMSIDDYFMHEGETEEKDAITGKMVKKPTLKYEFDEKLEETYINSLKRAFKRSLTDGYFSFLIMDAVNDELKSYADIWNYARQNGFQVYVCTMELDPQTCFKRNIHNRKLEDIQVVCTRFFPTPAHHIQLDPTTLLQSAGITEVQMEDVDHEVVMEDAMETEVESSFTSKWEKMDDAAQLARLDGTNKPLRPSQLSMEDYLQLDEWKPNTAKPGKKTVRWADLEERREQEKMRAIGFVVGQTDWNRMTDPTMGSSALTQTKYIERVRRF